MNELVGEQALGLEGRELGVRRSAEASPSRRALSELEDPGVVRALAIPFLEARDGRTLERRDRADVR
jgi:hypothetical protein